MQFQSVSEGGAFFKPKDHVGHLIVITEVIEKKKRFDKLKNAETDIADVMLADLDDDGVLRQQVLSHAGLTNKVQPGSGSIVARVATVDTGKANPAYVFQPVSREDIARAQKWWDSQGKAEAEAAAPAAQTADQDDLADMLGRLS